TGANISSFGRAGHLEWKRNCGTSAATAMALPDQLTFVPTDAGVLVGLTRDGQAGFSQMVTGALTSPAYRRDKSIVVANASSTTAGTLSILPTEAGQV